jgi:uncharacterized protein YyaL (SSP411 family)
MPLPAANLLSSETSPYLLQHSDNAVHWRPWGNDALAEARETGRPILVSVGYAACHWCHVMAHECFEDAVVAAVMNRLFVNIKIDREERPDLDQIFMAALTATGEQGGWPLTMFLTPDGKPFWGGTYFPREARYGRPGFVEVLEAVSDAWRTKAGKLSETAAVLSGHVKSQLAVAATPRPIELDAVHDYAERIGRIVDMDKGGIRGAPKFPNAPMMNVLRLDWLSTGATGQRAAALHSVGEMLKGGIYDHIGGGLSRYSTDADWLVPHFEKMLYDNAQLIDLAGWAYGETGNELFRVRIEETIEWLLREMRAAGGAFASSLDADSEGEEGRFYTWNRSDIESILGSDTALFLSIYRLNTPAEWHGAPIISLASGTPVDARVFDEPFRQFRAALLAARDHRIRPQRDDKILVDWNGLAITAIARAARQFSRRTGSTQQSQPIVSSTNRPTRRVACHTRSTPAASSFRRCLQTMPRWFQPRWHSMKPPAIDRIFPAPAVLPTISTNGTATEPAAITSPPPTAQTSQCESAAMSMTRFLRRPRRSSLR